MVVCANVQEYMYGQQDETFYLIAKQDEQTQKIKGRDIVELTLIGTSMEKEASIK